MGDVSIKTQGNAVTVDKIKGTNISIDARLADVKVTKVVEGGFKLVSNNLVAKMINGEELSLSVLSTITCDAMYGNHTTLKAIGDCKIGLFKGNLKVSLSIIVCYSCI